MNGLLGRDGGRAVADALRHHEFTIDGISAAFGPEFLANTSATDAVGRALRSRIESDRSPLATLTSLLLLGNSVDLESIRSLLPDEILPILQPDGSSATARFEVSPYGDEMHDWWVVSDRTDSSGRPMRSDHVLGIGGAATSLAQLTVRRPVARALDVGTGCGVQALHLATHCSAVTATDVVPRALTLAATTAELCELEVELLEGDLTTPVAGRSFDLVVCNPPFSLGPAMDFAYRDSSLAGGGSSGDAFCRRAVRACARVLDDGGVAHLLVNWLHERGEDWRDRVASWVSDLGCDAWLIERERIHPVDYVRTWLADAGQSGADGAAAAWLEWLNARDVEAIGFGWVTLRRGGSPCRVAVESVLHEVAQPIGSAVASWLDATAWLRERSDADLLEHAFRRSDSLRLDSAARAGHAGWETVAESFVLDDGFRWSLPTDELTAAIVAGCNGHHPLGSLVEVLQAAGPSYPPGELAEAACATVRGLIDRGVLLP